MGILQKILKKASVITRGVLLFAVLIPIAVLFFLLCFLEPLIVKRAYWGGKK